MSELNEKEKYGEFTVIYYDDDRWTDDITYTVKKEDRNISKNILDINSPIVKALSGIKPGSEFIINGNRCKLKNYLQQYLAYYPIG